jgi:hypothetical protein
VTPPSAISNLGTRPQCCWACNPRGT